LRFFRRALRQLSAADDHFPILRRTQQARRDRRGERARRAELIVLVPTLDLY